MPGKPVNIPGTGTFQRIITGQAGPHMAPAHPTGPGRQAGRHATGQRGRRSAGEIDNASAFADVDPDTGTLPALVYGELPGTIRDGTPLAIAVNGRIGAVTQATWADKQGRRFAALVADERLFVPGANTLDVYEVAGDELRRLPNA